jgi:AAA15 family ATPase/GTPase
MKINKIFIKKFRGFENVEFELGSHLTVISGQNGTQKTTLLGLLTQPFSITEKNSLMKDEKPLCGGSFKSGFSDKFKLSKNFDKAGEHEWTLFFNDEEEPFYTVESIYRDKKAEIIRFWQKGNKSKGSGYIQLPVIYLSLKRLLPIGEESKLKESMDVVFEGDEIKFYKKWHNEILILTREKDKITSSNYLSSTHKQTLGANTNYYDWQSNSAGQDNIGKILLAILSFRRLKEKYGNGYKGGILAIDELDTAFYPGAQTRLLNFLNKFASKYDIQIIFTTHSLTLLEESSKYQDDVNRKQQIKLVYLKKEDNKVIIKKNIDYRFIKNDLNRTLVGQPLVTKIDVYTEDKEGAIFAKSLLGRSRTKYLNFQNKIKLGCSNLIQLASSKVPSFIFPNSIIILDGDVKQNQKQLEKTNRIKNILLLPTEQSPEQIIAKFLNDLSASDSLWTSIDITFDHEYCFMDYPYEEIQTNRDKAKRWFNSHLKIWGINANKVLNPWKKINSELVEDFCKIFDNLYKRF